MVDSCKEYFQLPSAGQPGTRHTAPLSTNSRYMDCIIREVTEIEPHPKNMNRDGLCLRSHRNFSSTAWKNKESLLHRIFHDLILKPGHFVWWNLPLLQHPSSSLLTYPIYLVYPFSTVLHPPLPFLWKKGPLNGCCFITLFLLTSRYHLLVHSAIIPPNHSALGKQLFKGPNILYTSPYFYWFSWFLAPGPLLPIPTTLSFCGWLNLLPWRKKHNKLPDYMASHPRRQ
jgi:hypothetical protein